MIATALPTPTHVGSFTDAFYASRILRQTSDVRTIAVQTDSGMQYFAGRAVWSKDGREVGTVAGSVHLAFLDGTTWTHCAPCNKALKPGEPMGQSLGFPLCPACDVTWQGACLRGHGRLPAVGEFWCGGCGAILIRAHLCPSDADGRHRWRCKGCRKLQWQRAKVAWRERRALG